jgi:carboxyl-terminal processing protease
MRLLLLFCSALTVVSSLNAQRSAAAPVLRPRTAAEDLQLFSQVFNQIRINHPDSVDSHRLFMAAIQAMVQATDPHSAVFPAVRLEPGKAELWMRGRLVPVPIVFSFVGGSAVVVGVGAGTAASQQGILPGDELTHIDGRPMRAESELELEVTLAGTRESTVKLTFERRLHDGTWSSYERTVRRQRVDSETAIPVSTMLDDTTGYVRVASFDHEEVSAHLRSAVQRLERDGMKRLVLDLRDNGGGYVGEAATIAGEFLPTGTIIYTSSGRRESAIDTGRVSRSFFSAARRYPMVVMINENSASASELVAGALQDHDRATIVGRPSFGKALMMQFLPLSDGSLLYLTVGQVRTPCGRTIQRAYRDVSVRNYYRLAEAARDTAGLPTCKSQSGRVLYGGGGIQPDVRFARPAKLPDWIQRSIELDVPLLWVAGYVSANEAALGTREQFVREATLPESAIATYRALAAQQGVAVRAGPADDEALLRMLLPVVGYAKWGSAAAYQVDVRRDTEISEAIRHFGVVEVPVGRR